MEVLSSRILIRPVDAERSRRFYGEVLDLPVYREFGDPDDPGVVYHAGGGFIEVSGRGPMPTGETAIWLQVRDAEAEYARLAERGARLLQEPVVQPWGLVEAWVADPDGIRIVLVQVPDEHPLRRDHRGLDPMRKLEPSAVSRRTPGLEHHY